MLSNKIGIRKKNSGFSLIELLIVLPLVSIIFLISYNLIKVSNGSFLRIRSGNTTNNEMRSFITQIEREINNAKKAVEDKGPLYQLNNSELWIYTDIDNDKNPELIIYRVDGNSIKKGISKPINKEYPYEYAAFEKKYIVLTNLVNRDVFNDLSELSNKPKSAFHRGEDNRMKIVINLEIKDDIRNETSSYKYCITSSSRNAFD